MSRDIIDKTISDYLNWYNNSYAVVNCYTYERVELKRCKTTPMLNCNSKKISVLLEQKFLRYACQFFLEFLGNLRGEDEGKGVSFNKYIWPWHNSGSTASIGQTSFLMVPSLIKKTHSTGSFQIFNEGNIMTWHASFLLQIIKKSQHFSVTGFF